jgi:peptidoglycan/LPS O-acetylase OafA/YrhL
MRQPSEANDSRLHDEYLNQSYFPQLDGLRAISVLLVIATHLYASQYWTWLAGGYGVVVFFVLSGYLITTLALREESRSGRVSLGAFYLRRCCRLFPLYYLVLATYCVLIFGVGFGGPEKREPMIEALPYFLFYFQELPFFYKPTDGWEHFMFYHSWTLGIEEKFYFVWPAIAFVLWRGTRWLRLNGTLALTLLMALTPTLFYLLLGEKGKVLGRMFFSYYPILLGCLLAELMHDPRWFSIVRQLTERGSTTLFAVAMLVVHFMVPVVRVSEGWLRAVDLVYPLVLSALLCDLLLKDSYLRRLLSLDPMTFLGKLSYGVYLIHMLAMGVVHRLLPLPETLAGTVVAFVGTALVSIAGAWILSVTIETPCIRMGRAWSKAWTAKEQAKRQPQVVLVEAVPTKKPQPAGAGLSHAGA